MTRFQALLVCLLCTYMLPAQQLPLFTQYRENIGILNPAALSMDFLVHENNVSFGASYRRQWVGIDSAPKTQVIHGEYVYAESSSIGLIAGGHLINDQTGPTGFTGMYGRIAGIISDDPYDGGIVGGISLGVVQYRVNISDIEFREGGDILTTEDQSQIYPDVGVGVYYYQRLNMNGFLDDAQFYAGLSVPQVIGLDLEFKDLDGNFYTKRVQHYYGFIGLYKYLRGDGFLEPSVWVKYTENVPINIDFNLRYQMSGGFWLGAGGSSAATVHLESGFVLGENSGMENHLRIGYGFDYSFRSFGPYAGTSHELSIAYSFGN